MSITTLVDKKVVFVAMSGGVDSSVAAALLKEKGYDVFGVFIRGWQPEGFSCPWREDKRDAARVAAVLDIPFVVWDFSKEYKKEVADYMISEYKAGRTPNPDVMCNKKIKFGLFLKKALEQGADYIATGHYVRLRRKFLISKSEFLNKSQITNPKTITKKLKLFGNSGIKNSLEIGNWKLEIARDSAKDQSYFLWTLTQKQLKHCLFPVGDYLKPEVRKIARKFGLPTAEKKESQGVCFVGKLDFADFLRKYIPKKEGKVMTTDGKVIGKHDGVYFYTIGQRRGLKIGGSEKPYYAAEKNFKNNVLIVAHENDPALYKKEIFAKEVNWIEGERGPATSQGRRRSLKCRARIRYRQPLQDCRVYASKKGELRVVFTRPQRAVAQGQSVVFYKNQEMLGGGVIL